MCDVRKKLILANVVIEKFKTWQLERQVNVNEVFDRFSTTLLMKLLYLSCLFSIKNTQKKTYKETPFGVLDKWVALRYGPAEDDIYPAMGYQPMPTIFYDLKQPDGHKYSELKATNTNIGKLARYYEVFIPTDSNRLD
jgi:hypothetical protein